MRRYGKTTTILLLLCLTRSSLGENVKATEEKEFTLSSGSVNIQRFPVQDDGSFLYVTCNSRESSGLNCKIHVINPSTPEVVYPLKIATSGRSSQLLEIKLNGKNLFCFISDQDPQGNNLVSGFAHDLASNKTHSLALPSDLRYQNQYIGVFFDAKVANVAIGNHPVCGTFTRCKLVFDAQGQQVGKPVSFPIDYIKMTSFPKTTMDSGLFTVGFPKLDPPTGQAAYIDVNGDTNIMTITSRSLEHPPLLSNTGGLYGYCVQSELHKKLECTQFDWKSKTAVNLDFTVDDLAKKDGGSKIVSFANLNKSKFLFTTLECGKDKGSECETARVVTVDSHKNLLKSIPIFNKLKCRDHFAIDSVIAEVGDQLCVYVLCGNHPYSFESAHLHTKCMRKSDF